MQRYFEWSLVSRAPKIFRFKLPDLKAVYYVRMGFQFQANKMLVKFRLARCCRRPAHAENSTRTTSALACTPMAGQREYLDTGASTSCAGLSCGPLHYLLARFVRSILSFRLLVALLFGLQSYRYHQLVACVPLTGPRP